jgi:hypothetical protein
MQHRALAARFSVAVCAIVLCNVFAPATAQGQLSADQVLVVYNSQDADSLAVWNLYQTARPGVLGVDLNDPALTAGNISYADYEAKIRNPIQQYLTDNGLASQVAVLTLTKGLPHRIEDLGSNPMAGDTPSEVGSLWSAGNATLASVDSELTLLWQDLRSGEAGGKMDSHADNMILNPYHAQITSFNSFDRSNVQDAQAFTSMSNVIWKMDEGSPSATGSMYMTTRLDGATVSDVQAMIDRSANVVLDPHRHQLIIDENATGSLDNLGVFSFPSFDPGYSGDDYDDAAAQMSMAWPRVRFDETGDFLIGISTPGAGFNDTSAVATTGAVAALATYGGNHSNASQSGYLESWAGQLVDGAVFNSMESYNARQFGGLGGYADQGQLSQWIAMGGTFGVGEVWEPFASTVADNEFLLSNFFLGGMSWAEAAWSSLPYLSWQQLVIGDPLATVRLLSGDADGDHDVDGADFLLWQRHYGTMVGADVSQGDFDGDGDVDGADLHIWQTYFGTDFSQPVAVTGGGGGDHTGISPIIPEPTTATLCLATLTAILRRRRR